MYPLSTPRLLCLSHSVNRRHSLSTPHCRFLVPPSRPDHACFRGFEVITAAHPACPATQSTVHPVLLPPARSPHLRLVSSSPGPLLSAQPPPFLQGSCCGISSTDLATSSHITHLEEKHPSLFLYSGQPRPTGPTRVLTSSPSNQQSHKLLFSGYPASSTPPILAPVTKPTWLPSLPSLPPSTNATCAASTRNGSATRMPTQSGRTVLPLRSLASGGRSHKNFRVMRMSECDP